MWAVLCCPNELPGESFCRELRHAAFLPALLFASTFSSDCIAAIVFLEMSVVPIYLIIGRHGRQQSTAGRPSVADVATERMHLFIIRATRS